MFNCTKELGNVKNSTLVSIRKICRARLLQDIDESLRTRDEFLSLHTSSEFDTPSPVHSNVRFARETWTKSIRLRCTANVPTNSSFPSHSTFLFPRNVWPAHCRNFTTTCIFERTRLVLRSSRKIASQEKRRRRETTMLPGFNLCAAQPKALLVLAG